MCTGFGGGPDGLLDVGGEVGDECVRIRGGVLMRLPTVDEAVLVEPG